MKTFSKYYADYNVAGVRYWDAPLVIKKIDVGDTINLVPEPDNPEDYNAIALYWNGTKIGYVPRSENELIAQLFRFGHEDVFECRVLKVDKKANTWEQIHVGLYFTDKRD